MGDRQRALPRADLAFSLRHEGLHDGASPGRLSEDEAGVLRAQCSIHQDPFSALDDIPSHTHFFFLVLFAPE